VSWVLADLDGVLLERRAFSMDDPEAVTRREEAPTPAPEAEEDGFKLVSHGKKKKAEAQEGGSTAGSDAISGSGSAQALAKYKQVAALWPKAKVPFHDPSIPRPQEVYKITVDIYKPFEHVWLEHSEDGARPVHPLVSVPPRSCLLARATCLVCYALLCSV
jgi:exosome complex exonuclease RRP6